MGGEQSSDKHTAATTLHVALGIGRATAIAQAIADNPPAHTLAAEVKAAKQPFDDALDAVNDLLPIARQIVGSNDVVTDPEASKPARVSASMSEQEGIMVLAEWLVRIGAAT